MRKSYLKLLKLNAAAEVVIIPAKRNVSNNAKLSLTHSFIYLLYNFYAEIYKR